MKFLPGTYSYTAGKGIRSLYWLLFLAAFWLSIPASDANVPAHSSLWKIYEGHLQGTLPLTYKEFRFFQGPDKDPLAVKLPVSKPQPRNHPGPKPSQTYLQEKRKSFADRGNEPFIPSHNGILLGTPYVGDAPIQPRCLFFIPSWADHSLWIRPPPAALDF